MVSIDDKQYEYAKDFLFTYGLTEQEIDMYIDALKNDILPRQVEAYPASTVWDMVEESDSQKFCRELYMMSSLIEHKSENAIEKLIAITEDQIHTQYTRVSNIETKAGFLLALIGVLINGILSSRNVIFFDSSDWAKNACVVIVCGLFVYSSGTIAMCLLKSKYKHIKLESMNNNFICSVDSREIFLVRTLVSITDTWRENEIIIRDKESLFNKAFMSLLVLLFFLLLIRCLGVV